MGGHGLHSGVNQQIRKPRYPRCCPKQGGCRTPGGSGRGGHWTRRSCADTSRLPNETSVGGSWSLDTSPCSLSIPVSPLTLLTEAGTLRAPGRHTTTSFMTKTQVVVSP